MRIDAYNQIQQIYNSSNIKKADEKKSGGKVSFRDELKLSSTAIEAQIAKQSALSAPDIRQELVAPLKEKIEEGTYEVSVDDFTDKLLEKYNGLF